MIQRPPVVFPSLKAWAVGYLDTWLSLRPESYASGVTVRTKVPSTMPARMVQIADDGGPRGDAVTKVSSVRVNVWAETDTDAEDLALLIAAAFEESPGDGPVVAHLGSFGPYEVPEQSGKPHYLLSVDLGVRGLPL